MSKLYSIKTNDLTPYARNARTHSPEQVSQIAASIKEFGFINPVITDSENGIIAGHGRVMAAHKLGLDEVPCIKADHLSEAQKRAYILADNKLALNADWDTEMLRVELTDLQDVGFDVELTGFGFDEIEELEIGDTDEDSGGNASSNFLYQEKYAVLVECVDEREQEKIFKELTDNGFKCRVLVN